MRLEVRAAVEPPVLEMTLDPVAGVDRDGVATITGTVTCTAPDGQGVVFQVNGSVRQRVGRGFVDGFFFAPLGIPCDGSNVAWSALAVPDGSSSLGARLRPSRSPSVVGLTSALAAMSSPRCR